MAKVRVSVIHDETGRILSIARPSDDVKVVVLSGDGESVLETDVEEDSIGSMVDGNYRVDVVRGAIVAE